MYSQVSDYVPLGARPDFTSPSDDGAVPAGAYEREAFADYCLFGLRRRGSVGLQQGACLVFFFTDERGLLATLTVLGS